MRVTLCLLREVSKRLTVTLIHASNDNVAVPGLISLMDREQVIFINADVNHARTLDSEKIVGPGENRSLGTSQ